MRFTLSSLRLSIVAVSMIVAPAFAEETRDDKHGTERHHPDRDEKPVAPTTPTQQGQTRPQPAKPAPNPAPPTAMPHPSSAPRAESRPVERPRDQGFHGGMRPEHWSQPRFRFLEPLWMTGYWYEGWFAGLYGWWWVAGGQHYLYDHPTYPYPTEVSDMVLDAPPEPPTETFAMPAQAPAFWYYCDNPAGYYPYVQTCGTPFRAVTPH